MKNTEQDITGTIGEIETLQAEKQELEISIEKRYEILKIEYHLIRNLVALFRF
ncbi:hypothetical protein CV093_08490 [Oceanobacillus sp. 143]|nr:hypothetical protein CV093_08490 [Oceanobacillus sp. 143]